MSEQVRIDKWLWAARFYKTRAVSRNAIQGGKVHLNGTRVKPGRILKRGDMLRIVRGEELFEVRVEELNDRRGPAIRAVQMYVESEASIQRREEIKQERALAREQRSQRERRPDKRQRRQIMNFRRDKSSD